MKTLGILLISAFSIAAAPAPSPPASGVDVAALVRQARADYAILKKDQFAARTLSDAVAGKTFSITLVPHNGDVIDNSPVSNAAFYSYQDGKLSLNLSSSTIRGPATADFADQYVHVLEFTTINRITARQVGSNGYGARAAFDTRSVQSSALALIGDQDNLRITWDKALDGPAAKAIALSSKFVVHGIVSKLRSGHVGECATGYAAATFDSPTELVELNCYIGATITQVDLIGPGGLLQTWKMANAGAALSGGIVPATPAVARGNAADWITPDDYPAGETVAGTTSARLQLDSAGAITGCAVEASSGSARLDAAACMLLSRRAQFSPAKDEAGDGIASSAVIPVAWRKPS